MSLNTITENRIRRLLDDLAVYEESEPTVFFEKQGLPFKVKIRNIMYFMYEDRKVHMITIHEKISINISLREVSKKLEKFSFEYSHRAYLVNLEEISKIEKYRIHMSNGDVIDLAQKKAAMFKNMFKLFLMDKHL